MYENPSRLLFSFFKLYAAPGGSAVRSDVVRIISIAAVTRAEISRMLMVTHHLPRFVKLSRFQSFLAVHPNIIDAFRLQLWNQLPDSSKLSLMGCGINSDNLYADDCESRSVDVPATSNIAQNVYLPSENSRHRVRYLTR